MSGFDDFFPYSGPRTARGGIKSQSTRGPFAKNWWARRWISVIESFDIGGRLGRGRTYARQGQVLSIDIQEGLTIAFVQGSRAVPYKVEISVKMIPQVDWYRLSRTAFSHAINAAKLLAGEMPEDIERVFKANEISLFPEKSDDLTTKCSCPDLSNPCKHIAAVYYLLGEEFDRDPFLLFRLRGMSKERLLTLISSASDQAASAVKVKSAKKKGKASKGKLANGMTVDDLHANSPQAEDLQANHPETWGGQGVAPLPVEASLFWKVTLPAEDIIGSAKIPSIHASLPKRLGNLPFWRGDANLLQTLEDVYRRASELSAANLASEDGMGKVRQNVMV